MLSSSNLTDQLKASVEHVAAMAGRKIEYLFSSALPKEALVQELMRREKIDEGLVCVFSCVEPCRSFGLKKVPVKKHIDLELQLRKCLHWYLDDVHPVWGLCHVRIQSWDRLPACQVDKLDDLEAKNRGTRQAGSLSHGDPFVKSRSRLRPAANKNDF